MKNLILFIVLLFAVTSTVNGQKVLALKNTSRVKISYYPEGSFISLGMDTLRIAGRITSINDSLLIINKNMYVPVSKIDRIYKDRWFAGVVSSPEVKLMGIIYLGLTAANRTLNEEYPVIDAETLLISAGLHGGVLLLNRLAERKIKIGEKWKLQVIEPGLKVFQ